MNRILFVLLPLILLLTACSPALAEAPLDPSATSSPTTAASSTPTFFPTPTQTPRPTVTPTPTPTPITLPVTNGTPIPDLPYEVITAENVHRLRQIARYGYPRLLETNPHRLTADGKTLVVGTTLGLEFYDAKTQEKTGALEVEFLRDYDLTPNGQYLLTLAGDTLTVWKRDGQKVREFNLQAGDAWQLNTAALSPDRSMLAVQRKKTDWQEADKVDVYRTADGSLLDTVRGNGVLFSPDGQYLATVFDGSVRLYPVAELGQGWEKRLPQQTLPWCGGNERCGLAFAPDGHLAAVIRPSRVDVYQVEGRKLARQVSGWESDGYALPQVQFADGQMLVTTTALYDRQGNVQSKAQAIVVDIASGEWVSRSEVEEGFAYLDGGQVRTFRWQAEGEMPVFGRPKVNFQDGILISEELVLNNFVVCKNQECVRTSMEGKFFGRDYKTYTLSRSEITKLWNVTDEHGQVLASFSAPENSSFDVEVFQGKVVVVNVIQGRNSYVTAYRVDGKRSEIAKNVLRILSDGNKIAFSVYQEGLKVLDTEQWTIKRYEADDFNLIAMTSDDLFVANQNWKTGPSVQVINISSRQSRHIRIPGWKNGIWGPLIESSAQEQFLLMVDSSGFVYVIDKNNSELIHEFNSGYPYPNTAMTFTAGGQLFATYGADGFIRVWAVVPEGANVR